MFCSGFSHCRGREYSIIFTDSEVHKIVQSLFPLLVLIGLNSLSYETDMYLKRNKNNNDRDQSSILLIWP